MRSAIDLVGRRFGSLVVVERFDGRDPSGQARWVCQCDCGKRTSALSANLRSGRTTSCGPKRSVEPSEVVDLGDGSSTVPVSGGRRARVDNDDLPLVMPHRWRALRSRKGCYAAHWTTVDGRRRDVLMHRLILGEVVTNDVDHINGDGLDNRRSNLRPATRSQNNANRAKAPGATSRFKGVYWNKSHRKWRAQVTWPDEDGRIGRVHLGAFDTEEAAARAYDAAARRRFGAFATLNFPTEAA